MEKSIRENSIIIFFIGLILTLYQGYSNVYLLMVAVLVTAWKLKKSNFQIVLYNDPVYIPFCIFIAYYFATTLVGIALGSASVATMIEFIEKYFLLPVIIIELLPEDYEGLCKVLASLRNFIVVCAIYGLITQLSRHNYLADTNIVQISNKAWFQMENGATNYQSSSIFLHYSYYSFVLLFGYLLVHELPLKNTLYQRIIQILLIEQLLASQSRMAWITFLMLIILFVIQYNKKMSAKSISKYAIVFALILVVIVVDSSVVDNLLQFISNRFSNIFVYKFNDDSFGQRIGTLQNFTKYMSLKPIAAIFGTGYMSVTGYYLKNFSYFIGYSTTDNLLTSYLVEVGIFGTIILILSIVHFFAYKCPHKNLYTYLSKTSLYIFILESSTLDLVSNTIMFALFLIFFVLGYKVKEIESHKDYRSLKLLEIG